MKIKSQRVIFILMILYYCIYVDRCCHQTVTSTHTHTLVLLHPHPHIHDAIAHRDPDTIPDVLHDVDVHNRRVVFRGDGCDLRSSRNADYARDEQSSRGLLHDLCEHRRNARPNDVLGSHDGFDGDGYCDAAHDIFSHRVPRGVGHGPHTWHGDRLGDDRHKMNVACCIHPAKTIVQFQ